MPHFLTPLLRSPGRWGLKIARTGAWLVEDLEVARDSASRKRGLLGRRELAPGSGFLIAPTEAVHTFGMQFPIDVVAVSRDGRVVKWREAVPPRRLVFAWRAFAFVELPAQTAARLALSTGDTLLAVSHSA